MHQQEIIDYIVEQLNKTDCKIRTISLTAKESELRERLKKDIEEGKKDGGYTGSKYRTTCLL